MTRFRPSALPAPGSRVPWRAGPPVPIVRLTLGVVGVAWMVYVLLQPWGILGFDAYAYWAVDPDRPYQLTGVTGAAGAWRYSPVAALAAAPLGLLPWPLFFVVWTAILLVALTYLVGRWAPALLLLPPVAIEIYFGNIDLLLAAAIVAGFRWPALWSFVLLTKPTLGVGLVWFAARRQWRALGIALGTTAVLALPSLLLSPHLWLDWLREAAMLGVASPSAVPIAVRLAAAALLTLVAARMRVPELVPVAALIAMPWPDMKTASLLVASIGLYLRRRAGESGIAAAGPEPDGSRLEQEPAAPGLARSSDLR